MYSIYYIFLSSSCFFLTNNVVLIVFSRYYYYFYVFFLSFAVDVLENKTFFCYCSCEFYLMRNYECFSSKYNMASFFHGFWIDFSRIWFYLIEGLWLIYLGRQLFMGLLIFYFILFIVAYFPHPLCFLVLLFTLYVS